MEEPTRPADAADPIGSHDSQNWMNMMRQSLRRFGIGCCLAAGFSATLMLAAPLVGADAKPEPKDAKTPAAGAAGRPMRSPERIKQARIDLEEYYAKIYSSPLRQRNRMAQLVGVMSLSRIVAEPLTASLLNAAEFPDPLVAQFAWEAIYARQETLSPEQAARWVAAGFKIERRGGFPGMLGLPLLAAARNFGQPIDPGAASNLVKGAAWAYVNAGDAKDAAAFKTLFSGQWDPAVISAIVTRVMSDGRLTEKLQPLLAGLAGAPTATGTAPQIQAAWRKYAESLPAAPDAPIKVACMLPSTRFAKPVRIEDPFDPKWLQETELPLLKLGRLDMFYCIDSTGSMNDTNQLLAASLLPLTRARSPSATPRSASAPSITATRSIPPCRSPAARRRRMNPRITRSRFCRCAAKSKARLKKR